MKQFDDIFREKAGKAFSTYNADHLADEGWNLFLAEKKKEQERNRFFILPVWGKAAMIALAVGLGALIIYLSVSTGSAPEIALTTTGPGPVRETPSTADPVNTLHPSIISADMAQPGREKSAMRNAEIPPAPHVTEKPDKNKMDRKAASALKTGRVMPPFVAENMILLKNDILKPRNQSNLKKQAENETEQIISPEIQKPTRRTTFLTGLSGTMAYVNDAATATPGVSVGFYLEHKISGRLSFRPGLAVGMSSLGIDNNRGNSAFAAAISMYNNTGGTPESFNGHLNMVTMEVPLNIVLKLLERKSSSVYLSAGASTIFYISEHFTGDFVNKYTQDKINESTGMTYTETKYSTVSVEDTYSAFSHTDYLGLATLSAGYSLPLGKTSILRIEPFMQFPLNNLTSLDLRVYYTGVSMKINPGRKVK